MNKLREHILSTYLTLRYGIILIAALLPIVVYAVGKLHGVVLQKSMSQYYWAGNGVSRDWFVGSLFAVAAFLYLYKGFSGAENIALNLAAIFAVGVAVFPTSGQFSIHGFCAVSMFLCLVYVVWFRAGDTLPLIDDEQNRARYRQLYKMLGLVMLASPVTAFVLNSFIGTDSTYVFFIEAAGIWAFSAYWWVKSSELQRSAAMIKAVEGEVQRTAVSAAAPVTQN